MNISLAITVFVAIWILSKFLGVSLRGPIRVLGGLISLAALMFAHVVSITVILTRVAGLAAVIWVLSVLIRRVFSGHRPRGWGQSRYYGSGYTDGSGRWHDYR